MGGVKKRGNSSWMSCLKPSLSERLTTQSSEQVTCLLSGPSRRSRVRPAVVPGPGGPCTRGRRPYRAACSAPTAFGAPPTSLCGPSSSAGCKPRRLQTTSRMSSQPEDGWHGGSGSGDGQAPPARNAADDAAFPNPRESIQGAEGVLPATAPTQRTPGAVDPRHGDQVQHVLNGRSGAGRGPTPNGKQKASKQQEQLVAALAESVSVR